MRRAVIISGALAFALAGVLGIDRVEPPQAEPPCPFPHPILCAELPPDGATLSAWLAAPPNPASRWRREVLIDYGFLLAYGALLAFGAMAMGAASRLRRVGAASAIAGAALDAVENTGILMALADGTASDTLATTIRAAAFTKFALLGVSVLATGLAARAAKARWASAQILGGVIALVGLAGMWLPALWWANAGGIALGMFLIWGRALRPAPRAR